MAITIRLIENSLIFHYVFSGAISRADLDALSTIEAPYFNQIDDGECLYAVADFSGLDTIESDLLPLLGRLRILHDSRICQTVFAGANPYLRAMAVSLGIHARNGQPFKFYATLEDAVAALENGDG